MSYALVGTAGAPVVGSGNTLVTATWGTSQTRSANNLLILHCFGFTTATLPTTPSGWTIAKQVAGTSCSSTLYYRIATGADAAPAIAAVVGTAFTVMANEFSGGASSSPVDQTGSGTAATTPIVATNAAVDAATGELLVYVGGCLYSAAQTASLIPTLTNATAVDTNNNATSNGKHYDFGWGFTTAHASADKDSMAVSTGNLTGGAVVIASFKLGAAAPSAAGLRAHRGPRTRSRSRARGRF